MDVVQLDAALVLPPHDHAQVDVSHNIAANLVHVVLDERFCPQARREFVVPAIITFVLGSVGQQRRASVTHYWRHFDLH